MTVTAVAALTLFCPSALHAQAGQGTISGLVTDTTGSVVPNAQVTITGQDTGVTRVTRTNQAGNYNVQR